MKLIISQKRHWTGLKKMGDGPHPKTAIILVGGFGTRLKSTVPHVPKPLAPIGGKPFLEHQLLWLANEGIEHVILAAHYRAEQVLTFANADAHPVTIDVVVEDSPLGTGGAILNAMKEARVDDFIWVMNGDTYISLKLADMWDHFIPRNEDAMVAVAQSIDTDRYGNVEVDNGRITAFKSDSAHSSSNRVNAGVYIMSPKFFQNAPGTTFSLEHDFFPEQASRGHLYAFDIGDSTAFQDFGTPESYHQLSTRMR